jgi:prepilin-type N-terminal cleavage/methylation domain-containing protein/prepilin-type processing-associated H-X9-DG protein
MDATRNMSSIYGNQGDARRGFTLVELLVVIAIIGVLVALLLPAVQAAREAARRTQCSNQVRQIGLAIQNHVDALGSFPSGGNAPHPKITNSSVNGRPRGPERQGLGWAFQILPYLEQNAVHSLQTQEQMEKTPVALYFCPSRRPPTQGRSEANEPGPTGGETDRWLIDYAAVTAAPTIGFLKNNEDHFWGNKPAGKPIACAEPGQEFFGVIVRTPFNTRAECAPNLGEVAIGKPTKPQQIEDGLSNTLLVGEKRLHQNDYAGNGADGGVAIWHDDRGWSDGWDPDTVRSTAFNFGPDGEDTEFPITDPTSPPRPLGFMFGSGHSGGMNVVYADASVHFINYEIDALAFNRMGHKSDGEQLNDPAKAGSQGRL